MPLPLRACRRVALVALVALALVSSSARADQGWVIEPGQEAALGDMLGMGDATTVAGCKLDTAQVKLDRVEVTYACGANSAKLFLHHPEQVPPAQPALAHTQKFALVPGEPAPSPALVSALETRIRAGEGAFSWARFAAGADVGVTPTGPTPHSDADKALFARYQQGFALYRARKHKEALAFFLAMAREHPDYAGVLGQVVANLAPTQPDDARVAEYQAAADRAPDDPLAQFVAGVAAHYSAHYRAKTRERKRELYAQAIRYIERARPAFDFEPRVFIYLAVSHFRLGEQAEAEALIEKAIALSHQDPDAYYCRAEIYQRKDVDKALADIEKYQALVREQNQNGETVSTGKQKRVQRMADHLRAVKRGEAQPTELWDPLVGDARDEGGSQPRAFALLVGAVAIVGVLGLLVAWVLRRRRAQARS